MELPKVDFAPLLTAATFAADKHRDQRRKDVNATPYINHPLMVANVLATEGAVGDVVTLQAALLHDTLEDTDTSYAELVQVFGKAVADVVVEVTDDKSIPSRAERKRLQLEHASTLSERAALIKISDKICNLRDIAARPPKDWTEARKREYAEWARAVVQRLVFQNPRLTMAFERQVPVASRGQ